MNARAENMASAGWMTLAMAGYVTNDAFIKLAAQELPLFQSIFLRGLWICLILTGVNLKSRTLSQLHQHFSAPLIVRLICETLGTIFFLTALIRLPLAGLTAVVQVVPLVVVFVAARILGEPVGLQRTLAVLAGFLGVLLIVRPGAASFSPWYILGFATIFLIVIRELATRRVPESTPSQLIALLTAIAISTMGLAISIFQGWEPIALVPGLQLVVAGIFLTVGYVASVATVRVGDLSFSAPFRYSIVVFSILLQIVVFGEVPDALTFVGTAIVVGAGLWAFKANGTPRQLPSPVAEAGTVAG